MTVGDKISAGTAHGIAVPIPDSVVLALTPFAPDLAGVLGQINGLTGTVTVGAGAISVGGAATVNINAAIDPPPIGGMAITIGGADATVNVNAPTSATLIGALAVNILGTGNAIVNITPPGSIQSNLFGVIAADIIGSGNVIVTPNGNIQAGGFGDGILAVKFLGSGDVIIAGDATGATAATGNIIAPGGEGIEVVKIGAIGSQGNVIVNMAGSIGTAADPTGEAGIRVFQTLDQGTTTVTAGPIWSRPGGHPPHQDPQHRRQLRERKRPHHQLQQRWHRDHPRLELRR